LIQLIYQFGIDVFGFVDEGGDRRVRRGTEQPTHCLAWACAFHLVASYEWTVDGCITALMALDEPFFAQALYDLGGRRERAPLTLTELVVQVANGARTQFPQLRQHGALEVIGWRTKVHDCGPLLAFGRMRHDTKRMCPFRVTGVTAPGRFPHSS